MSFNSNFFSVEFLRHFQKTVKTKLEIWQNFWNLPLGPSAPPTMGVIWAYSSKSKISANSSRELGLKLENMSLRKNFKSLCRERMPENTGCFSWVWYTYDSKMPQGFEALIYGPICNIDYRIGKFTT